jgi:hypothetical protein
VLVGGLRERHLERRLPVRGLRHFNTLSRSRWRLLDAR